MNCILAGLLIIIIFCCSGICLANEKQAGEREPQNSQDQTGKTKRVTKKVGPFEIGKKSIAVILDITEYEGHPLFYHSFEIKDEEGVSYYRQTFGSSVESWTAIEGIFKLEGKSGEGLILFFNTGPSAPLAGKAFQVFGVEEGKIKPLSSPISVYGSIKQFPEGKAKEVLRLFAGDIIEVEVWKDWFGVYIPLAVDLQKLTITPFKAQGIFDVNIASTPNKPYKYNTIEFYHDHNIKSKVKKIVAATIKNVEFLNVYSDVQLKKEDRNHELTISVSNLWLKVKINGSEGWVKGDDDFLSLGLFPD